MESIAIDLLGLDSCPSSGELAFHHIEEKQKSKNAEHIYILIHNLDGVELQNFKTQHVLSRICSLKNVHLVASIDRVNAALSKCLLKYVFSSVLKTYIITFLFKHFP